MNVAASVFVCLPEHLLGSTKDGRRLIWAQAGEAQGRRASFQQRQEVVHAFTRVSRCQCPVRLQEKEGSGGGGALTGALGLTTTLGGVGCGALLGVTGPPLPP